MKKQIDNNPTTSQSEDKDKSFFLLSNIDANSGGTTFDKESEATEEHLKVVGHTGYDVFLLFYNSLRKDKIIFWGTFIALIIFICAIFSGHIKSFKDILLTFTCILVLYVIVLILLGIQILFKRKGRR